MELTQEILKDILDYNPDTGIFVWKVRDRKYFKTDREWRMTNTKYAGKIAGNFRKYKCGKTYQHVKIFQINHLAHRIAWRYVYGETPIAIDHIDGDSTNNRIENLRNVTIAENQHNMRLFSTNTSGVTGVIWRKQLKKWCVSIYVNKKEKYLGVFSDLEEAKKVRKEAEIAIGYHANHGKVRPL